MIRSGSSRQLYAVCACAALWAAGCRNTTGLTGSSVGPGRASSSQSGDVTDSFRDELAREPSPAGRRKIADEAIETALNAEQSVEAVRWLVQARASEPDSANIAEFDRRILNLIDSEVSTNGLEQLLNSSRPGTFPHEHLLFKVALIQLHSRSIDAATASFQQYLQAYPNGQYAMRAEQRLRKMQLRGQISPRTIGVLMPLTGPRAPYGRLARQALELAFQDSTVQLIIKDTQDNKAATVAAVDSLVFEHQAVAILGPIFNAEARAAALRAQQLEVPLLAMSRAEEISAVGPWVFRNGVNNKAQAKALVAYAMEVMNLQTFAILHPRHPYGIELRDLFWDEVIARGGEIRGIEAYNPDATTFSNQVKHLVGRHRPDRREDYLEAVEVCAEQPDSYRKARCVSDARKNLKPLVDFDGLFIPDGSQRVRMITAALAAEDIIVEKDPRRLQIIEQTLGHTPKVVTLLGASGWNSPKITESTGRTVENAIFVDGFFSKAEDLRTVQFVETYLSRYGREPRSYLEALVYDSARILRRVIETHRPLTRKDLRDALLAVRDFPGVTGDTSFAGNSDAVKELKILTITDGTIVEVPNSTDVNAEPQTGSRWPNSDISAPRRRTTRSSALFNDSEDRGG